MVLEELTDWLIRVCKVRLGHGVRLGRNREYYLSDNADDEQKPQMPYKIDSRRIIRRDTAEYQPRKTA